MDWSSPRTVFGRDFSGHLYELRIFDDGTHEAKAQSHAQPEQPFPVEYETGDARLPAVHNKLHNQWFPPPTEHLGVPLADAWPVNVALVALGYYRNVLAGAQDKFGLARGNGSPPIRRL